MRFARTRLISTIRLFADNSAALSSRLTADPQPGQSYIRRIAAAAKEFLDIDDRHSFHLSWCPSHVGIPGNERADVLAKGANHLPRDKTSPEATATFMKRLIRERLLLEWHVDWASAKPNPRYDEVQRDPPSLKPSWILRGTFSRRVVALLTQIRIGHCFSGEYSLRHRYSQDADQVECPCGTVVVQTRRHILCACPLYEEHRHILLDASADLEVSELLGTQPGLLAVAQFCAKTGAFSLTGTETMTEADMTQRVALDKKKKKSLPAR